MLHNLDWLKKGNTFPPKSEVERLKTYIDNRKLFQGKVEQVLPAYRQRIRNILNKFIDVPQDDFKSDLNYWQLVTVKTADLVCGEPPTITVAGDSERIDAMRLDSNLNKKLLKIVYDVSRFGDCIVRVKKDKNNKNTFSLVQPDLWFPIVSYEDAEEITEHCLAWVEEVGSYEPKRFVLKVQEHFVGYYINRVFEIDTFTNKANFILASGLNIEMQKYKIGREITEQIVKNLTGLDDFAIVPFQNIVTSDSCYSTCNDYDRITAILAELEVRYALENVVLDKHSAPTVSVPETALMYDQYSGEWKLNLGGIIPRKPDDVEPAYLTWDGNLESNHQMIDRLEKHLYSLSEMGAVINDDAFGASQGFEALETRLMNARLKARRMSSSLTTSLAKLIDLLSQIGYERVFAKDVSICWNDGLPNNEFRETDIAIKKMPLFSTKTLLKEHFARTDEDADVEIETRQNEVSLSAGSGFSVGVGGDGQE